MKILVACEESQVVTKAFRERGHVALSCDIEPCSGGRKDWHLQQDVTQLLEESWDMIIAFPPCTHLASSGARWFKEKIADGRQQAAIDFFMLFTKVNCPNVAIENPIGIMSTKYRKPDQIIQPWQFGHDASKSTCLWLKNLPKLKSTEVIKKKIYANRTPSGQNKLGPSPDRSKLRAKTYTGVANAMSDQWGDA